MKKLVLFLILLLAALHQDFWWRVDSHTLVLGFVPVSLAYHIGVSIAATILWGLACVYLWPKDVDVGDQVVCEYPDCQAPNMVGAQYCARCGRSLMMVLGGSR